LRNAFPTVTLIELESNRGFTGGNEAGVAASHGDVLVFINNDMRVAPDAIQRLVSALDGGRACVAARVLSWDGTRIDFLRGALNFEGRGYQDFYGAPADGEQQTAADSFFANGGAFAVTRDAYRQAGGFDTALFAYYDDVDLGWRLRLTGRSIRVEDTAVVWHRHGATVQKQPAGQKRFLMERNALISLARNYGEPALQRTFGATLLLAVRRALDESRFGSGVSSLATLAYAAAPALVPATAPTEHRGIGMCCAGSRRRPSRRSAPRSRICRASPRREPPCNGREPCPMPRFSATSAAPSKRCRRWRRTSRCTRGSSPGSICRASSTPGCGCSSSATRPSPPTCRARPCDSSNWAGRCRRRRG
jgi:GT2 family glycosyltransferase